MEASAAPQRFVPPARAAVLAPELVRPDWTAGTPRDPRMLWLDRNENLDPALAAVAARVLAEISPSALSTYPESAPLYRKLATFLDVGADRLLLAAGSDGVIRSVFEAFVAPGDVVLHTVPTFAMYAVYCRMYGARTVGLAYRPSASGPRLGAEEIVRAVATVRPKLVCLPNPDSPTGTVLAPDELRRIVEASEDAGAVVLVDEAYHPFHDETVVPWTGACENLVVARTFAKAWGLAGLRIGYAVAAPAIAHLLHKVRPMYEVNTLAVAFMERMLDHAGEMRASVRRLNEGRDGFLAAMRALGLRTLRSHGNFLHVAFGAAAPQVHAALDDLVYYRRDFTEPCLRGFSRFSATTPEIFRPVVERVAAAVRGEGGVA